MISDSNPINNDSPSAEQVENLLRSIQPKPSSRLYHRLAKSPWQPKPSLFKSQKWGVAILLLACFLVATIMISPPLRAMARNWIMYFLPDRRDSIQISLGDLGPQELYQYAAPENFPDSIDQVSKRAGFSVRLPATLLPEMSLVGARYEENSATVVLLYKGAGYNLFLSERPIDVGQEYFTIGASAVVEEVSIDGIRGEYVSGGWIKQPVLTTSLPDTTQDLPVQWDASLPQHTLRWQAEGYAYQLRSTGSLSPEKSDLIVLAEALIK